VHDTAAGLPAGDWNRLLHRQAWPTPFMQHEYLAALEQSGSATTSTGWHPQWLGVSEGGDLTAACALYLKSHSYGEYQSLCSIATLVQVGVDVGLGPSHASAAERCLL
jgi:hypothetical protein